MFQPFISKKSLSKYLCQKIERQNQIYNVILLTKYFSFIAGKPSKSFELDTVSKFNYKIHNRSK